MAETTYATGDDLAAWIGTNPVADTVELALAVGAASRAVDRACGRSFGLVDSPQVRYYTSEYDRHLSSWFVDIDDLQTTDDLAVEVSGSPVVAYQLTPINAASADRPWTRLEFLPAAPITPNGIRNGVKVTARWGWSAVPDSVKLATIVQAARLFARRESPSGPLSSQKIDDVAYSWAATDLDADVAAMVAPYRKIWSAA